MEESVRRRVVVGVGLTQKGHAPLHRAAAEARLVGGELWVVHAWELPAAEYGRQTQSWVLAATCQDAAEEQLLTTLDAVFGSSGPGVPTRCLVVRGTPGRALVTTADREDDLLILGSGSRRWPHRLLWPSVARYCLAHASCPVLAVPPSPLAKDLGSVRRRIAWRLPLDARELTGPLPPG
ncbi:universal stress protein [Streptomyces sp. NBC_00102]|uniref:universal stress protein n=1 Tax=Streptomyces sp. NBC_00102 TaxID=2975652 RepID=UPI00224DE30C|nr:universal stress protein [Streptomyces sp. NBC_00102]MCX5401738.1 universal stress protein [Streptomyces sp. NBC_00102]